MSQTWPYLFDSAAPLPSPRTPSSYLLLLDATPLLPFSLSLVLSSPPLLSSPPAPPPQSARHPSSSITHPDIGSSHRCRHCVQASFTHSHKPHTHSLPLHSILRLFGSAGSECIRQFNTDATFLPTTF